MSEQFDPYHRWLGIPAKEQPPNYYRLLGLVSFESDPEVIRDAAERQMSHVRRYELGAHSELSQRILNELGAAKACLRDAKRKSAYDNELRAKFAKQRPGTRIPAMPLMRRSPETGPTAKSAAPRSSRAANESQTLCADMVQQAPNGEGATASTPNEMTAPNFGLGELGAPASSDTPQSSAADPQRTPDRDEPVRRKLSISLPASPREWVLVSALGTAVIFSAAVVAVLIAARTSEPPVAATQAAVPVTQPVHPARVLEARSPQTTSIARSDSDATGKRSTQSSEPYNRERLDTTPRELIDPHPAPKLPNQDVAPVEPPIDIKSVPPKRAPADINPFSGFSEHVALPSLQSHQAAPLEIGLLARPLSDNWEVDINSEAANVGEEWEFTVLRTAGEADTRAIYLIPKQPQLSSATTTKLEHVAQIIADTESLVFQWHLNRALQQPTQALQLCNCILELRDGSYEQRLHLRDSRQIKGATLDLTKGLESLPLEIEDVPLAERLFFEIIQLAYCDTEWKANPTQPRIDHKGKMQIELVGYDGVDLDIIFDGDALRLQILPRYRVGDGTSRLLTLENLETHLALMQKTLAENSARLVQERQTYLAIGNQLSFLRRNQPSDIRRISQWQAQGNILQRRQKASASTITLLEKSLPRNKAAVDELTRLLGLATRLNQTAEIQFRVGAFTSKGDIDLLMAGNQPESFFPDGFVAPY